MEDKICIVCTNKFIPKVKIQKMCSASCREERQKELHKESYKINKQKIINRSTETYEENKLDILKKRKSYYINNVKNDRFKKLKIIEKRKEINFETLLASVKTNTYGSLWDINEDLTLTTLKENGMKLKEIAIKLNRTYRSCEIRYKRIKNGR